MDTLPYWIIWGLGWVISLAMVPFVSRRHEPSAAVAWLAVVFFAPIVGVGAYVLVGRSPLPQRRIRRRGATEVPLPSDLLDTLARFHTQAVHDPTVHPVVALSRGLGDLRLVDGNAISITADTTETFTRIARDVDAAQEHVHVLFYIFEHDDTGRAMVDLLLRTQARGVQCRVLADDVGSRRMLRKWGPELRAAGVRVQAVLPVGPIRSLFRRIDLRNHRKLVVIDGRLAYTGSQNVTDADNHRRGIVYYDVMARIEGPAVALLQQVFVEDWYYETNERLEGVTAPVVSAGDVAIQPVPSGPNYPSEAFLQLLVSLFYLAQERVVLTTPYFMPTESLLVAIESAVQRGVKVELVLPERSDLWVAGAASRAYAGQVAARGVHVHLFQGGLLHTKSMTVDGSITVLGTGNLDVRSFFLNLELNLLVPDAGFTGEVLALQQAYLRQSVPIDPVVWAERRGVRRWSEDMAKLFSPLL